MIGTYTLAVVIITNEDHRNENLAANKGRAGSFALQHFPLANGSQPLLQQSAGPLETPCHRETIATGHEHLRLNEDCIFSSNGQLLPFSLIPIVKPVSF